VGIRVRNPPNIQRRERERERKRQELTRIQFAKLEMAVMISMFVAHFDYHLVDADGNPTDATPDLLDRSQHQVHRPTRPVFIKYELRK